MSDWGQKSGKLSVIQDWGWLNVGSVYLCVLSATERTRQAVINTLSAAHGPSIAPIFLSPTALSYHLSGKGIKASE